MRFSNRAVSINSSSTLAIDAKVKQMIQSGLDVISFGVGEPDFDTPDNIKEAAIKAIREGFTKYTPSSGIPELREAVCMKLKNENGLDYGPSDIVITNGAKQALMNAITAICNSGDEIIIPAPYWVSYVEMVKLSGGIPVIVRSKNNHSLKVTADDIRKAVTPKTRAIILNSPNNPTGMVYGERELSAIAELAVENGIAVISDEIYAGLIYDGLHHVSIASLGKEIKENTVVVNGLSKTYAMTGWRIGYSASDTETARIMGNVQSHSTSNSNSVAQKAAIAALNGPKDSILKMKAEFCKRRDFTVDRINQMRNVDCLKPEGAFYVMMDITRLLKKNLDDIVIDSSDKFATELLKKERVAVVPGSAFGADNYIRISYATSMEKIKCGLDRIDDFISLFR